MKRLIIFVLCITAVTALTAMADDAAGRKQAAMELVEIMNGRAMRDEMVKAVDDMMEKQFEFAAADLSAEARKTMEALKKEYFDWLSESLSWEQMRTLFVDVYTEVFTEEEMKELNGFYRSPLGRKMLDKMPRLIEATMRKSREMVQKKLPEFNARLDALVSDVTAKYRVGK
ncbi:MAG TPA: DUF2059 domain-containing protein [Syntrophorhabdaceae bacterium]